MTKMKMFFISSFLYTVNDNVLYPACLRYIAVNSKTLTILVNVIWIIIVLNAIQFHIQFHIRLQFHVQFHIQFHIQCFNLLPDYLLLFGNFTPIPQIYTYRVTNLAEKIFQEISLFSRKTYIVCKIGTQNGLAWILKCYPLII